MLIRKKWLQWDLIFTKPCWEKKIFTHSSQYDSGYLKDQTSIPVEPENFQVLFQPA